jgi:chromosome segregation protein
VIFGGSEQRKPQGMAEAVLTLDNGDGWLPIDFAEVSIGRRAYRSGETEYLINGARARLRDVVALLGEGRLGANELVVVGQGTVDAALSLRPEERRQLFEEAAGVKALQVRRNEASVRLARSLDNLARVSDLIGELKPQVRRLAMQAEHQQQHDTLGSRARALLLTSHRRREQAVRAALGDARRRAAAADAALDEYRAAQEAGREAIATAEARYWEAEEASRAATATGQATREALIRLESRAEAIAVREADLAATLAREERELDDLRTLLASVENGTAGEDVDPALAAASDAERAWQSALAEVAAADDELIAAEQAVAEERAAQSDQIAARARAHENAARQRARRDHAEREHAAAEASLATLRASAERAAAAHQQAARAAGEAPSALEARERERDAAQATADATRQQAVELEERLRATRAELAALAEPHDAATRLGHRLSAAGWPSLLDTVDAPEGSWPAIEAVVGGELESALLWSDRDPTSQIGDARGAVRLLAPAEAPGNGSAAAERRAALSAVRGQRTLAEWIGSDAGPGAFAHTVVAGDLDALLTGWHRLPAGWSAVTSEGDLADARGIVLRGRGDPPGGASARAHARRRELAAAVADLEHRSSAAQQAAHDAAAALREVRTVHLAARESHDEAERAARVARQEHDAASAAAEREAEQLARLDADLAALVAEDRAVAEPSAGPDRLADLQAGADAARARRDHLARRRDEAREAWNATRRAAEEIQARTAGAITGRATREARLAHLTAAIPDRRRALERATAEREELAAPLESARQAAADADAGSVAAEASRAARRADLQQLEGAHGGSGARLGALERESQAAAIEASRRDEALAALLRERELALESLPETDDDPRAGTPMPEIEALDDEALEAELRRVRRTLAQIGSVNPFAVEEHRELGARLDEMTTQDVDLRAAITSTEELIGTLDAEISAQFDAAFRAIGERFDEYCRLLFAGGSASLQMADEADGDAPGGIEIVVRPPGKRLQRLGMLSGGERALTGVALLFAMLTVNPVPFCILDEVDAALDEANIGRFADALRRLAESIDFVVITHNRATIEVADTIYGVTMTDAAVSRVLSLRLSDIPADVSA